MSVRRETTYGCSSTHRHLRYRYAVSGINPEELLEKQNVSIEDIEEILNIAFTTAEEQIEKELYKKGLMTCNSYLKSIADMRVHGNDLVQNYIKELDEKYKENLI